MNPEKQIEKLHEAMTLLNRDNATSEDVTKLFKLSLETIDKVKKQLTEQMSSSHGELNDKTSGVLEEIETIKDRLDILHRANGQTKDKLTEDLNKLVVKIFKEVKRIEDLIPTIDFSPIVERITKIETTKTPEITASKVRDKLESLTGEERLDVYAVKSAPKITVSLSAPNNPRVGDLWGQP